MAPTSKATPSQRRGPSLLSKVSTPPATARANKGSKPSLIIRLKLSKSLLHKYAHDSPSPPEAQQKAVSPSIQPESESTPSVDAAFPVPKAPTPKPEPSDASSTAKADSQAASSTSKTGVKRELGEGVEGDSKTKGRPGPKKKVKLYVFIRYQLTSPILIVLPSDGSNGTGDVVPKRTGTGAAHKLGPKANQGAINAGLRALDRTGTPCRKWQKGGFKLKSFTGHSWALPSWSAPAKSVRSEGEAALSSVESKSASKDLGSNSNVESDHTPQATNGVNGVSSPAPRIAITA